MFPFVCADEFVSTQDLGLAKEAAYNLSLIYVTTGAASLADGLYRKWLSL